jgi:uncharacterized protein YlxW (UPF0749 family)
MTIGASIVLAFLLTLLVGQTGWLFGKAHAHTLKIKELEARLARASKENDVLIDSISSLSINNARLDERIDMLEDRIKEMDKKIDDSAQAQEEAAAAIAKQIEKKWDNGLQNMLAWNPFGDGSEGN